MSRLRFKVGDIARIVRDEIGVLPGVVGEVVEVVSIGAHGRMNGVPYRCDYGIRLKGHSGYAANDSELEPIGDASEDPALTRLKKLLKQDQPKPVRVQA